MPVVPALCARESGERVASSLALCREGQETSATVRAMARSRLSAARECPSLGSSIRGDDRGASRSVASEVEGGTTL
jgi:hypothetical protein